MRKLTKSSTDVEIAGVLGGIAEYFGWDSSWVRIGFVILTIGSVGSGILLYILMAMIMPDPADGNYDDYDDYDDYD